MSRRPFFIEATIVLLSLLALPGHAAEPELIIARLTSGSVGKGAPAPVPVNRGIQSQFSDALREVSFLNGLTQIIPPFGATNPSLKSDTPDICQVNGLQITILKAGACTLSGSYGAPPPGGKLVGALVVGENVVARAPPSQPPAPAGRCPSPGQCVVEGVITAGTSQVRVSGAGPNGASLAADATVNPNGTYTATFATTPGQWRFTAVAKNANGSSPPSEASAAVVSIAPVVIPAQPQTPVVACANSSCTATGTAPEGTTSVSVIATQSGQHTASGAARTLSPSNVTFNAETRGYTAEFQMPAKDGWTFKTVASSSIGSSEPSTPANSPTIQGVVNPCGGTERLCAVEINGSNFAVGQPLTVKFKADPNNVTQACLSVTQTRVFGSRVEVKDDRLHVISANVVESFQQGSVSILTNNDCNNWPALGHWGSHGLDNPGILRTSNRPGAKYVGEAFANKAPQAALTFDVSGLNFSTVGQHLEATLPVATGGTGNGALLYSATGPCAVSDGKLRATGIGTCTVTATKAASTFNGTEYGSVTAESSVSISAPAGGYSQSALAVTPPTLFLSTPTQLQWSGGSGDGAVSFVLVSGSCSINGSTITATNRQPCTIRATRAGNALFASKTSADLVVTPACSPGTNRVVTYTQRNQSCALARMSDLGDACTTETNPGDRVGTHYGYAMLCYEDAPSGTCLYVSEGSCPGGNGCQPWQLRAWNMGYPSDNRHNIRGSATSACVVTN